MPPQGGIFGRTKLVLLCVLALLICNTAAGLASRLAGGLALAASAVLYGLCNIFGFNSIDSLHFIIPPIKSYFYAIIISQAKKLVKCFANIYSEKEI